jgi:hypothetical protein
MLFNQTSFNVVDINGVETQRLSVSAGVVSTVSGNLAYTISGSGVTQATATANLGVTKPLADLAGTGSITNVVSANITVAYVVSGAASVVATTTGSLSHGVPLADLAGTGAITNVVNAALGVTKNLGAVSAVEVNSSGFVVYTYLNDVKLSSGSTVEVLTDLPTSADVQYSYVWPDVANSEIYAEAVSMDAADILEAA